jgi:hypothetical protein
MQKKYLPSFAELIDRLTIVQQKEILNQEFRDAFTVELEEILHDIDLEIAEKNIVITSNLVRDIMILTLMNSWIWANEAAAREKQNKGQDVTNDDLVLTHQLNDLRSAAKKKIQEQIKGRIDYKLNSVKADNKLIPSGY